MKTDIPIKAEVRCDDGVAGTSEAVIVDPLKRAITHLVLREHRFPHTERLVPVDLVAWTTEDEVHLRCSTVEAAKLDRFVEGRFVEVPQGEPYPIAVGAAIPYLWPFAYPREKVLVTHQRIPQDELAVRRSYEVDATDGRVGRVEAFLVDRDDDHITHVVVRSGHLARREFAVPVSDVAEIAEDRVTLRLDRRGVEHLPRVPYHQISLLQGIDDADAHLFPRSRRDAGIGADEPDGSHLEGTHLLAQEAERRLGSRGFTRDQILDWAKGYEVAEGTGGVDGLVSWIDEQEHR
jgi:hypothetical protein